MRSLNLRRAAIAAALVFLDLLPAFFSIRRPIAGSWVLAHVVENWLGFGVLLAWPLTVLALLAFGARMIARQHVRAGGADPLEGVRRRVAKRRWLFRTLYAGAALFGMILLLLKDHLPDGPLMAAAYLLGAVVLPPLAVVLALRTLGRAAISPLVDPAELDRRDADGFLFSAVAVTAESRAAVGLLALLTVGIVALLASTDVTLTPTGLAMMLGYSVVASLMALSFRSTSRIAIGLDGVRVSGSARLRFHAYRDLDGVDVTRRGEVLLLHRGKAVLRLQLHGEDAARRGPIVERIRAAIARAHAPEAVEQQLAEAAKPAVLARAARGDGDYRSPAASRDALWEVVEAPSARRETRTRAARALAVGADHADHARLRFAAARCADPKARRALARIALGEELGEEEDEEEAAAPAPRRAALQVEGH